jgi:DNA-binding HxlR family transcriptional regulator
MRYKLPTPIRPTGSLEWLILDLLLGCPQPWRIAELIDQLGSAITVAEALEALQVAGLIQRTDAFVRLAAT